MNEVGEESKKQTFVEDGQILAHRRSNAVIGWLAIVLFVLLLLWVETRNTPYSNYNLFLNGDSIVSGAKVLLDGKMVGEMNASGGEGFGGSIFYGYIENGRHKVEVKKDGFEPFVADLDMSGEAYLGIKLKPIAD